MFSLTDFSPISDIPREHRLVVNKCFFDGGNEADSTQYQLVTLAAFSGDALHWRRFDKKWNTTLMQHGVDFLHTTDAIGLTKAFSKRQGWSEKRVYNLISDCVSAIELHAATRRDTRIIYPGIRPATVSILLKDFKMALAEVPDLGTPENICAIQCFAFCYVYGIYTGASKFQLFFDRNEPFYGHVLDRMNNRGSKRRDAIWRQVYSVTEADMRHIPGLQAADLLAWSVNHEKQEGKCRFDWQQRIIDVDREKECYEHEMLLKPNREVIDLIKTWKLPKRRAPR